MAEYKISADVTANVSKFKRAIDTAKRAAQNLKRETEGDDIEIDGDVSPLKRAVQNAKRMIAGLKDDSAEIKVDLDDGALNSRIAYIKAMLKSIPNKIRTRVDVDYDRNIFSSLSNGWKNVQEASERYQNRMDQVANSIRTFGTVMGNQIKGSLIASFSAAIPVVASLVPAVMAVGNAIAVVGGGAIGLGGSFGILYAGVGAFAGMAKTALSMLEDGTIQATSATKNYQTALDGLKTAWQGIVKSNSTAIFQTMANGLNTLKSALSSLTPFFTGVANGMQSASQKMLNWVQTSNIAKSAFQMLNTTGVSTFNNMLSGVGRFGAGLVSIFTQFGPLFQWVSQGFANMGKAFMQWATSVETSKAIQNFINYTKTNLPLIGQIFGNTFKGLFNLFKAFAPNSQSIFQGLAQMSTAFAEWSAKIAASDGFQKFIQYVQTNGPVVMGLIGSLVGLIINIATAMAPLGAAVLRVITGFTQWLSKMTELHPIIGIVLGVIGTLGGILMAIIPTIISVTSFITPLIGAMLGLGTQAGFVEVALAAFSAVMGALSGPVLAVIAVIGSLVAVLIYLWNTNEGFRSAVVQAWNFIMKTIQTVISAVSSFVMEIWGMLVSWWQQNNQLILQTIQTVWNAIGPIIMAAIQIVVGIVKTAWAMVQTVTQVAWELIKGVVRVAVTLLGGIIRTVMQIINGDWKGAWETIKQTAVTIWNIIKSTAMNVWNALKSGIVAIMNGLKSVLTGIWNAIKALASTVWNAIKAVITTVVNAIKAVVTTVWNAIKLVVTTVMNAIKSVITTIWNAIKSTVTSVVNGIKSVVTNVWNAIKSVVTSVMNAIKSVITSAWNAIKSAVTSAVNAIKSVVTSAWNAIKSIVTSVMNGIKSAITNAWNAIKSAVTNAMNAIKSAITSGMNNAKSAVRSGVQGMVSAAKSFVGQMVSAGGDLIRGMINGIKNMAGSLVSAAKGVVSNAINAAKSLLKIHSPSRVFRDIGQYTMMGMTIGINNEGRSTVSATADMARKVTDAFNPQLSNPSFDGGNLSNALSSAQSQLGADLQNSYNITAEPNKTTIAIQLDLNDEAITAKVNGVNALNNAVMSF